MTDITELAQRMSIERIKQIALGGTPTMGERESLAITALHFAEELKIATDAFQAAGLAQLAAEEALEKAQQRIAELECQLKSAENNEIDARCHIADLESRTVTPVTYSENADADYCRKWAWEQVKGEVSTEDWTTGDSITYFGFFCWGWDMRRQYNEQRPVTVKLPQRLQPGADGWDDWYVHSDDEGEYLKFDDVLAMLTAAGIKVEDE